MSEKKPSYKDGYMHNILYNHNYTENLSLFKMLTAEDQFTQKLLSDFIFLDCRLADHPKIQSYVFWKKSKKPELIARTPMHAEHPFFGNFNNNVFIKDYFEEDDEPFYWSYEPTTLITHQSGKDKTTFKALAHDGKLVGVLVLYTPDFQRLRTLRGLDDLLAVLLVYSRIYLKSKPQFYIPELRLIGSFLSQVREQVDITVEELAAKTGHSVSTILDWEMLFKLPSWDAMNDWCQALGLISSQRVPIVKVIDISPSLLKILKTNPEHLRHLSPSKFEHFVAERLDRMGFDVTLTGTTTKPDGGIDLIATPKVKSIGSFLLAGQVKHHRENKKTGVDAVKDLLYWKDTHFRLGLLVTNTAFTKTAQWVAAIESNRPFLRLRDFSDLKRWLEDNFSSEDNWREIPEEISLTPNLSISIPKLNIKLLKGSI